MAHVAFELYQGEVDQETRKKRNLWHFCAFGSPRGGQISTANSILTERGVSCVKIRVQTG